MKTMKGQRNLKGYNRYIKILYPVMSLFFPSCSLQDIARAMIKSTIKGYKQNILEVEDIIMQAKN
jgi:hypothetical protein